MRRLWFWVGTALLALGIVVLLVAGGLYAYGLYDDLQTDELLATETPLAQVEPPPTETPASTPAPSPTVAPSATPEASASVQVPGSPSPTPPSPTPTSTPPGQILSSATAVAPDPQPATRIRAASIGLDAPVTESAVRNGQWVVPKFAAGHLQGTAQPGGQGNAVYAGHVSSRSSGDVFANIGKLKPGDAIVLVTKAGELRYEVADKVVVRNDDLSVTKDKGDERITLITCTGTWLPLQRDFDRRLIVFAKRVG